MRRYCRGSVGRDWSCLSFQTSSKKLSRHAEVDSATSPHAAAQHVDCRSTLCGQVMVMLLQSMKILCCTKRGGRLDGHEVKRLVFVADEAGCSFLAGVSLELELVKGRPSERKSTKRLQMKIRKKTEMLRRSIRTGAVVAERVDDGSRDARTSKQTEITPAGRSNVNPSSMFSCCKRLRARSRFATRLPPQITDSLEEPLHESFVVTLISPAIRNSCSPIALRPETRLSPSFSLEIRTYLYRYQSLSSSSV